MQKMSLSFQKRHSSPKANTEKLGLVGTRRCPQKSKSKKSFQKDTGWLEETKVANNLSKGNVQKKRTGTVEELL